MAFVRSAAALFVPLALAAAAAACGDIILPGTSDGGSPSTTIAADGATIGPDGAIVLPDGAPIPDGGADGDGAPGAIDCTGQDGGHPTHLFCSGLYSDWATKTLSPGVRPFDPGLHLWSDGAEKSRWIQFPTGTQIDTTDLNEWKFPVGTKVWKEFKLVGKRAETRFLWKQSPFTWFRTTFVWREDESAAEEQTSGLQNFRGLGYTVPATDACGACHNGRKDMLLGFELVSLASPNASGLALATLRQENLLTNPPQNTPSIPGDALTQNAIGHLHANCGTGCHNSSPSSLAGSTGLWMRLDVDSTGALPATRELTDIWRTAVGVDSNFRPSNFVGQFSRIKPRDVARSAIPYRDGRRGEATVQMPPLATNIVDQEGLKKVTDWINSLP